VGFRTPGRTSLSAHDLRQANRDDRDLRHPASPLASQDAGRQDSLIGRDEGCACRVRSMDGPNHKETLGSQRKKTYYL